MDLKSQHLFGFPTGWAGDLHVSGEGMAVTVLGTLSDLIEETSRQIASSGIRVNGRRWSWEWHDSDGKHISLFILILVFYYQLYLAL